jgi:hypothetical protein
LPELGEPVRQAQFQSPAKAKNGLI